MESANTGIGKGSVSTTKDRGAVQSFPTGTRPGAKAIVSTGTAKKPNQTGNSVRKAPSPSGKIG